MEPLITFERLTSAVGLVSRQVAVILAWEDNPASE